MCVLSHTHASTSTRFFNLHVEPHEVGRTREALICSTNLFRFGSLFFSSVLTIALSVAPSGARLLVVGCFGSPVVTSSFVYRVRLLRNNVMCAVWYSSACTLRSAHCTGNTSRVPGIVEWFLRFPLGRCIYSTHFHYYVCVCAYYLYFWKFNSSNFILWSNFFLRLTQFIFERRWSTKLGAGKLRCWGAHELDVFQGEFPLCQSWVLWKGNKYRKTKVLWATETLVLPRINRFLPKGEWAKIALLYTWWK